MSRTLLLIVFGGLAFAYVFTSIGESLIRKGAVELDRDALDRILKRELRNAVYWKSGEMLAVALMIAGLLKAWGFIPSTAPLIGGSKWGIPAIAIGFALFCLSSISRAWICRAAFAEGAPNSKASRGAFTAALLTTFAELAVGLAVCSYIYTHLEKSRPATGTVEQVNESGSSGDPAESEKPKPPPKWINATEALQLLKGKNQEYLDAIAARKDIRSQKSDKGTMEYHREDIIILKRDGMPSYEELNLPEPKS
jgi:hypothetical protein